MRGRTTLINYINKKKWNTMLSFATGAFIGSGFISLDTLFSGQMGNSAKLAIGLISNEIPNNPLKMVLSFIAGAFLFGLIFSNQFKYDKFPLYGWTPLLMGTLIIIADFSTSHDSIFLYVGPFIFGFQTPFGTRAQAQSVFHTGHLATIVSSIASFLTGNKNAFNNKDEAFLAYFAFITGIVFTALIAIWLDFPYYFSVAGMVYVLVGIYFFIFTKDN